VITNNDQRHTNRGSDWTTISVLTSKAMIISKHDQKTKGNE